jgi:phospholipase/carboxylesterase
VKSLAAAPALAAALALAACDHAAPAEPPPEAAHPVAAAAASSPPEAAGVRYVERLTGGASAGERLPMVVAIHGFGASPEDLVGVYAGLPARARLILPYGEPLPGGGFTWFAIGSLGDDAQLADGTARAADRLAAMIEVLAKTLPTTGAAIVTGFSQGGMLSYTLAVRHPEVVAAAFPVGGLVASALVPAAWPLGREKPPIRGFHGDADERVPIARARASVAALRAAGLDATLSEYAGVGHAISPAMGADLRRAIAEAAGRAAARP